MTRLSVKINARTFYVFLNDKGEPHCIRECKLVKVRSGRRALRLAAYWYPRHHQSRGPDTLVQRILQAVQ